jgi:hypothetical protein
MAKTVKTDKPVNYTAEQAEQIVAAYEDAGTEIGALADAGRDMVLDQLVTSTGRTKRSLVAKLVREGVYIKKSRVSKTGNVPQTKSAIVSDLAELMDMRDEDLSGMEAATKGALENIRTFILGLMQDADVEADEQEVTAS